MIVRRVFLTLVLTLFASVTIGVVLGLDDAARSDLKDRLARPSAISAVPIPSTQPKQQASAMQRPAVTPTPATTSSAPQSPKPSATRPSATSPRSAKPATPTPRSTAAASTKPSSKPSSKASSRPATPSAKPNSKATTRAKAKPKSSRYLAGPLKKGRGGTVYLTFDDGPGPFTGQVLDVLSRSGSTATFFQLGVNQPGYPHAGTAIRARGSNIANHTYNHPDLTKLAAAQLRWQIANGPRGKCFRPPYGATNKAVNSAVSKAGMRQVLWTVDTLDWTKPGVATLAKSGRLKTITNGSIILMHDGGGDRTQTVAALPTIIADLHARGYKVRALPYC